MQHDPTAATPGPCGPARLEPGARGVPPEVVALLDGWLPTRRWYPVKGVAVRHEPWATLHLPGTGPEGHEVAVVLLRLLGEGPQGPVDLLVQLPLVLRRVRAPLDRVRARAAPGLVGLVRTADGDVAVHDGGAHPACWLALLRALAWEDDAPALGPEVLAGARAVTGEQSNTSIVLPAVAGGAILKVLRTVAVGPNPDVTIPRALARSGWDGVPAVLGSLPVVLPAAGAGDGSGEGSGEGSGDPAGTAHLAVLSRLVEGARDGFEMACAYAARDQDFSDLAADLGRTVAGLHRALADVLPAGPDLDRAWLLDDLGRRARAAIAVARPLAARSAEILGFLEGVDARLAREPGPTPTQAVHGDLHLGQALHSRRWGWRLLDFEGEPLRPVAERTRPDLPLRDVAGILRSLDYAAAVGRAPRATWTTSARAAFLDAYRRTAGPVPGMSAGTAEAVLRALVLDKALYEVVYEAQNRPGWAWIPLQAVDRILGDEL